MRFQCSFFTSMQVVLSSSDGFHFFLLVFVVAALYLQIQRFEQIQRRSFSAFTHRWFSCVHIVAFVYSHFVFLFGHRCYESYSQSSWFIFIFSRWGIAGRFAALSAESAIRVSSATFSACTLMDQLRLQCRFTFGLFIYSFKRYRVADIMKLAVAV